MLERCPLGSSHTIYRSIEQGLASLPVPEALGELSGHIHMHGASRPCQYEYRYFNTTSFDLTVCLVEGCRVSPSSLSQDHTHRAPELSTHGEPVSHLSLS